MAENKLPFGEGASIHRPPMFSGINWKIRMKIFIESIDQRIWDAIQMDHILLSILLTMCRLISHGLNGMRKNGGEPNIIAMQRITSLHLSTWMSFFVFHHARVPRKCGRFLK